MAKRALDMMMEGLEDAIAYAEGDTTRGRVAAPINVKQIRAAVQQSQAEFASTYHIPIGTLRDWEQERRSPDAPARILLTLISKDPAGIAAMLAD